MYVRKDEVEQAIALVARPEVKLLLHFLWITGARVSEALAVAVSDVAFRDRFVSVKTLKRRKPMMRSIGKPA